MMKRIFFCGRVTFLLMIICGYASGEIRLPAIFGDNMVLQQQTDVRLWGKATPGKKVKVTTSWDNNGYSTVSDKNGNWKVKVSTPVAGGPYQVIFSDGKRLVLNNVLIGEVWLCSGQSNMGMSLKGGINNPVLNSNEVIATSANESIRLYTVKRNTGFDPVDDLEGSWATCGPDRVAGFSACAYFFAKALRETLKVPVGLINSSWGGTAIEAWMGASEIKKFDFITLPDKSETERLNEKWPKTPTILFNTMIYPLSDFVIKGVLWYQGEDNVRKPEQYERLLPGLINNWREAWALGDFPFYFAQLTPYDYGQHVNSAFFREVQEKVSVRLSNVGMVCLLDAGDEFNIHPANKKVVGSRFAWLALSRTYGIKSIESSGPVLKEMVIEGRMVNLIFDHAEKGLTSFGKDLKNFEVAGRNRKFYSAKAFITRQGVTLFSEFVNEPVAVRYAFKNFVTGDLYNTAGIPASSFRTDEWDQ